jgi:hypothetical protein
MVGPSVKGSGKTTEGDSDIYKVKIHRGGGKEGGQRFDAAIICCKSEAWD